MYELGVNTDPERQGLDSAAREVAIADVLLTQVKPRLLLHSMMGAIALIGFAFLFANWLAMGETFVLTTQRAFLTAVTIGCIALVVVGVLIGRFVSDSRLVDLFGRDQVVHWLITSRARHNTDTRLRIRRLGGTPPRTRAVHPGPRSRPILSWPVTAGLLGLLWLVMASRPTLSATARAFGVDVIPAPPQTVWTSVYDILGYIVSATTAVVALVVVRRWRRLTWTQIGIPYQRWLTRGRRPNTPLSKSRQSMTAVTAVGLLLSSAVAAILTVLLGGLPVENGIGEANPVVAIAQCIRAGIFEEITFLAIPAALVLYRTTVDRPLKPSLYVGLIIGSGVARALGHFYYGPMALVWAFTWGALVMAVYLRWRRLLPLIFTHIVYDLILTMIAHLSPS